MNSPPTFNRRHFLAAMIAAGCGPALAGARGPRPRRILLRSSWQTVNIGDIAHTPGVLALLERHLPEVEVRLWPMNVKNGVKEMLLRRFPWVKIVESSDAVATAFKECDFFLHGSAPYFVAWKDAARWRRETGKPYGVYGITLSPETDAKIIELLGGARFVFFRDSVSLKVARDKGCAAPVMEFGPDGGFGVDLRDEATALAFLKAKGLEEGKFLCCIPCLRFTPRWLIYPGEKLDETKHARNEAMKEHDHAPHREAIIAVTRQTGMKVLLCPESSYQIAVGKEMIYDKLPEDVKAKVVWRDKFWLTDEAVSVYVRSAGLFGNEMHSPIMCIGNGIPAIVCRWAEQTSKGIMWRDIGLGDWLFDMDNEADVKRVAPAVLDLAQDPAAAKAKAAKGREFVERRQRETMAVLKSELDR